LLLGYTTGYTTIHLIGKPIFTSHSFQLKYSEKISSLASQVDLAPTLLSLIGVSSCHTMIGRDFTVDKSSMGRAFLQFEDYYALMDAEKIIILRPNKVSTLAHYDEHSKKLNLESENVSDADRKKALAHVQLPSYLYRKRKNLSNLPCSDSNEI
jgi:phosphoglycerol transferase MdoB-like AlkP superfamily enzyme